MNRRLHSLPLAKLREFITYEAPWKASLQTMLTWSTPASSVLSVGTQNGGTDTRSGSSAVNASIRTRPPWRWYQRRTEMVDQARQ